MLRNSKKKNPNSESYETESEAYETETDEEFENVSLQSLSGLTTEKMKRSSGRAKLNQHSQCKTFLDLLDASDSLFETLKQDEILSKTVHKVVEDFNELCTKNTIFNKAIAHSQKKISLITRYIFDLPSKKIIKHDSFFISVKTLKKIVNEAAKYIFEKPFYNLIEGNQTKIIILVSYILALRVTKEIFLKNVPYPQKNISLEEAKEDFTKLVQTEDFHTRKDNQYTYLTSSRKNIGLKAIDYFSYQERAYAKRHRKTSPLEAWYSQDGEQTKIIYGSFKTCLLNQTDFTANKLIVNFNYFHMVSQFKPLLEIEAIQFLKSEYQFEFQTFKGIDPCGGWGGRALAAFAMFSQAQNTESNYQLTEKPTYTVIEPNPVLIDIYNQMQSTYAPQVKLDAFCGGIEQFNFEKRADIFTYDFCCTSPPYRSLEWYKNSQNDFNDEKIWNNFLYYLLNNSSRALRDGGFLLLNVACFKFNNKMVSLELEIINVLQRYSNYFQLRLLPMLICESRKGRKTNDFLEFPQEKEVFIVARKEAQLPHLRYSPFKFDFKCPRNESFRDGFQRPLTERHRCQIMLINNYFYSNYEEERNPKEKQFDGTDEENKCTDHTSSEIYISQKKRKIENENNNLSLHSPLITYGAASTSEYFPFLKKQRLRTTNEDIISDAKDDSGNEVIDDESKSKDSLPVNVETCTHDILSTESCTYIPHEDSSFEIRKNQFQSEPREGTPLALAYERPEVIDTENIFCLKLLRFHQYLLIIFQTPCDACFEQYNLFRLLNGLKQNQIPNYLLGIDQQLLSHFKNIKITRIQNYLYFIPANEFFIDYEIILMALQELLIYIERHRISINNVWKQQVNYTIVSYSIGESYYYYIRVSKGSEQIKNCLANNNWSRIFYSIGENLLFHPKAVYFIQNELKINSKNFPIEEIIDIIFSHMMGSFIYRYIGFESGHLETIIKLLNYCCIDSFSHLSRFQIDDFPDLKPAAISVPAQRTHIVRQVDSNEQPTLTFRNQFGIFVPQNPTRSTPNLFLSGHIASSYCPKY